MVAPTQAPTVGYLLWRLTTRLRTRVDRALAPLDLTHAQYTLLASLYGFTQTGVQPSQRELADWTGLEPIFVSKLARALERAGLVERTEHPADTRAVQMRLTPGGSSVAEQAIAIVHALQEEFTASIGGTQSHQTRALVRTLTTLLDNELRSDPMSSSASTLNGQDVGEAEGALSGLLQHVLASADVGLSRTEYIVLRVMAVRGPISPPAALHDYLADQPQLGLERDQIVALLNGLEARGLVTSSDADSAGPTALTPTGAALHTRAAEAVTTVTRRLYADLDPADLAVAHNVLSTVTQRARQLREEV